MLTPEQIESLKSLNGLDADEAQLVFGHISALEECLESIRGSSLELRNEAADLVREHREMRRVLATVYPRLQETECDCGDEGGPCDKHLVEITLANFPKH